MLRRGKEIIYMKKLSLLSLILAVVMLFSSCGVLSVNRPFDKEETTVDVADTKRPITEFEAVRNEYNTESESFMKDLSDNDYKGVAAKIVTSKKKLVLPEESIGTVLSKDLEERNSSVESTLNISLICEERDPDTMFKEIRACILTDTYYADAIMYPQSFVGNFVTGGAVMNLRGLPAFETDQEYLYPSAVAAGTGGDAIYAVAGPASLNPDGLSALYFNKDIIAALGLESPYDLVDRGEWTIDKYLEYLNAASAHETYHGYTSQNSNPYLTDLFFFSQGEHLTVSNLGTYPVVTLSSEKTGAVLAKIKEAVALEKSAGGALTAINDFAAGNILFLIDRLDSMKSLANSACSWGILPMPKYDAEQEKYATLAYYDETLFFSAVTTAPNYEMTADLIACINIMTYGYTNDAYCTNASYYYLRDNDSIRMLSTVLENPVYDFAYSFAGTRYNAIPSVSFMAIRNNVAGVSTLERYLNMWTGQFNNAMYSLFDTQN